MRSVFFTTVMLISFCSEKDPNTVFVSNLLFSIDEERLKETFLPVCSYFSSGIPLTLS